MKNIQNLRRDYGKQELLEKNISSDPFKQFETWLNEAIEEKMIDPTAMVLATIDEKGFPDSRVVLLKEFDEKGFVFFTHYNSPKSIQAEKLGVVALNFHWPEFARQVRIKGKIQRIQRKDSEKYFSTRPRDSQIATCASKQSTVIASREELIEQVKKLSEQYQDKTILCPETWGGYCVAPFEFEFFQGRDNRLNDRIRYLKENNHWKIARLSP